MNEVVVQAWVTRGELGLGDLHIHMPPTHYLTPVLELSTVTYDRIVADSRFVDGAVTVMRKKNQGQVQLTVDVVAATFLGLQQRKQTLIDAFTQDEFEFYIQFDTALYGWRGECADHNVKWQHEYIHNRRLAVTFDFPSNPTPIVGPA